MAYSIRTAATTRSVVVMTTTLPSAKPGIHETGSVSRLIVHAVAVFAATGFTYRPARVAKTIRKLLRTRNEQEVHALLDAARDARLDLVHFELRATGGYVDVTGNKAAARIDQERA